MPKPTRHPSDKRYADDPIRNVRNETSAMKSGQKEKRQNPEPESPRGQSDPGPDGWISGVSIVDAKPRAGKELRFIGKPRNRNFVILEEVQYLGKGDRKPRSYWAKSVRDPVKENRYIDAQARIVLHLKKFSIPGIWKAQHFLEVRENDDETYKMILCERFPPGETLFQKLCRDWKKGGPEAEALLIIMKVGTTVQQLHNAGVFHWDISAKNIWITDRRDTVLFDWDFAFRSTEEFLSRELWRCGTPHYLSKERLEAMEKGCESAECTLRTDAFHAHEVYTLVSVLTHMLIGNEFLKYGNHYGLPYNEHEVLGKRLLEEKGEYGDISPWLRRMLGEALANGKSPFGTVGEFLSALQLEGSP